MMPGMGGGRHATPAIVRSFDLQLLHQGLLVALVVLFVSLGWAMLRNAQLKRALANSPGEDVAGSTTCAAPSATGTTALIGDDAMGEAPGRRIFRIGFGLLWAFDGVLQGQASMPLGMVPGVLRPAADGAPGWARSTVGVAVAVWSAHPVTVAAGVVWAQIGLGCWLLVASRGPWSRLGGAASLTWGLVIWVFGEAFGGVFSAGQSWAFGSPGSALLYAAAGGLLVLPDHFWRRPQLGRRLVRSMGLLWLGMAVLQAWPGRGAWHGAGARHEGGGLLTNMARDMAATPQPHLLASWARAFASFDAEHGWAVNLALVLALAGCGLLLASGRQEAAKAGIALGTVLCLATWVLVQDLGFMGGVGTDPNSMVPMLVLLGGSYVAWVHAPTGVPVMSAGGPERLSWRRTWVADPSYAFRTVAALGAVAVTLLGALPLAVVALQRAATG